MKKTLFVLLAVLSSSVSMAQWMRRPMPLAPAENYTLSVGKATMVIDAANGARITSLKHDTTEVVSQNPMPNMYGSTFWTSPQKEWGWPPVREHDIMRYTVDENTPSKVVMTSQLSEKIPLRIRKQFAVDEKEGCFVITYTIINEGDADRKVAPWEITRVPPEGTVTFDAPLDGITPAGLMNFTQRDGCVSYTIDEAGSNRKINADGKGWLRYSNKGLLLTKRYPDIPADAPSPDEAEIQLYVHAGKVYVELEEQGPYTNLRPGESLSWTVSWYLTKE